MSNQETIKTEKSISRFAQKMLSDLYSIASFFYTPIDLIAKSCRTFRNRLLHAPDQEVLYRRSQFKRLIKKMSAGSGSIYKNIVLKCTALISTFVLQIISFFTTLAGVNYYFSSISPYAPLAFAFTIQFLFYILSNFGRGRVKFTLPRKAMLATVFFISMLFSYIGIINDYVPPIKTFEAKYSHFYDVYTSVLKEAAGTFKKDLVPPENQLELLFSNAGQACAQAETAIAEYDSKIAALSEVKETYRTGRNRWGYNTYESNPAYEAAQRDRRTYEDQRDRLKTTRDQTEAALSALSGAEIKEELDRYLEEGSLTPALAQYNNDFLRFTAAYAQLQSALALPAPETVSYDLIQLADHYGSRTDFIALELPTFLELKKALGDGSGGYSNDYLYQLSDRIEETVGARYGKFLAGAKEALPYFDETSLEQAYKDLLPLPDLNLLAVEKLRPSSPYFHQGLVALFLALLVDGMTVIIPLFTREKRSSSLFARYSRMTPCSEEETMEKILLSVSGSLSPTADSQELGVWEDREAAVSLEPGSRAMAAGAFLPLPGAVPGDLTEAHLADCLRLLAGYLSLFQSSPWTNEKGYSKYLTVESLDESECAAYCRLTDILCSLKYLTVVSEYEYRILVSDAQNAPEVFGQDPYVNPGETIYLMKKNFDLWISENLAGLLLQSLSVK